MIYFIFDNPADKQKMEFLKDYDTSSFERIFPEKQCKSIKSMLDVCINCIKKSSSGDTVIFWYDFMGIIFWWLCKIFNRKRQIVILNILLKNKKSMKNKVARILYKTALKSKNIKATVTSKEYGVYVNNFLGIKKQYIVLHDIYHERYNIKYGGKVQNNSVFCGGRNGRNWELLKNLANEMMDIQFNIVVPKDMYEQYKNDFGANVNIKTEITETEYLQLMCQSELVIMPLNTEAPAGLIAIFQAVANGKMTIVSDTVTTQEYFKNNTEALCKNRIDDWKIQIRYWVENPQEAIKCAEKSRKFLEENCTEKDYAKTLLTVVSE